MKSSTERKSILYRFLTAFLAVATVLSVLSGALTLAFLRGYIYRRNRDELTGRAAVVSQMLYGRKTETPALPPRMIREAELLSDARLIYVDKNMVASQVPVRIRPGRVPEAPGDAGGAQNADSRRDALRGTPVPDLSLDALEELGENALEYTDLTGSIDEDLARRLLSGESAAGILSLEVAGAPVMYAGAPIRADESSEAVGAVILCRPLTDIQAATMRVLRMLCVSLVFSLLIAFALAWFVSRRISEPIIRLNAAARQLSEGNYDITADIGGRDEIGQLGDTLNLLSGRLKKVIGSLAAERDQLDNIVSGIGEGIAAIGRDGNTIRVNAAFLNLLSVESREGGGKTPQQEQIREMLFRSMEDGTRREALWKLDPARTLAVVATPVRSQAREIVGAVCLVRDVSEQERLEQMRRDYIANISHELRTPLTGIRGMAEPLMDGLLETDEEKQECYSTIYRETVRLEKLIGEMLDLSRLQSGHAPEEPEPIRPWSIMKSVERQMRQQAEEGGLELLCRTEEEDLLVLGSEDRLKQVLIILTDNAVSFTPPGGSVVLSCRREGDAVMISVTDTGSGINPADLPFIWERFFKADRSRMRTGGTGLGLAIAKLAVEQMGGSISVTTQKGKGSSFTVSLKRADPNAEYGA
ncbi:MAG: HAMP domain-containing protein [Clostridia bacterium]|nr:HAMP domain-containing protein [Clostridia bacterium]